jgi:hypothetical protein
VKYFVTPCFQMLIGLQIHWIPEYYLSSRILNTVKPAIVSETVSVGPVIEVSYFKGNQQSRSLPPLT